MDNPYKHKEIEKILLQTYMPSATDKRGTRKLLRKAARHIERGYKIGFRDGSGGKKLVLPEEVPELKANSPFMRDIYRKAYFAYRSGYQAGREAE